MVVGEGSIIKGEITVDTVEKGEKGGIMSEELGGEEYR